jgi:hypothetical protein
MRRLALVLGLVGLVLHLGPGAAAKGGEVVADRYYYRVGETVVVEITYDADRKEIEAYGPYYLWLTGDKQAADQAPPLDPGALPVAPVRFLGQGGWRAEATFVIPDLQPGLYALQVCNDPCTHTIDVSTGYFKVALNLLQAQLMDRLDFVEAVMKRIGRRARHAKDLAKEQRRELSEVQEMAARVELLVGRVEDLERQGRPPQAPPFWPLLLAVPTAALAGFAGGRVGARLPRRPVNDADPPKEEDGDGLPELSTSGGRSRSHRA